MDINMNNIAGLADNRYCIRCGNDMQVIKNPNQMYLDGLSKILMISTCVTDGEFYCADCNITMMYSRLHERYNPDKIIGEKLMYKYESYSEEHKK